MTQTTILQKRNELKPYLQEEFAVKEIGVFGSFSDNTFHKDSDIDILVELEKPIGWRFFTLEMYLGKVFGKKIDLVAKPALKKHLKEQILEHVRYV